ncbi:aspartate aminotransferase family protein [Thermospira aquatica]|uniref:Acetylornithine aminotransferase n=1 Tax=Thermospira aquatica TaxID=2828656 RepID=A0AAX3BAA7_9SPIR|nr:aspartate aminotransferase family protein [Thermospira aquatica]URA09116.1 aspartate aminotransferase family protein [Thermospira aquatica]
MHTIEMAEHYLIPFYKRTPLVITKGKGCYVWDEKKRRYLDMTSGIAVVNLGHRHPRVVKALQHQAKRIWHISNLFYQKPQTELAEKLVQRSFDGMVFFANSGAEANDGALKIARLWGNKRGKTKVIALQQSFHGRTIATISLTGQEKYKKGFDPLLGEIVFVTPGNIEELRQAWDDTVCAIFLEVIQCEGGVKALSKPFLDEVMRLSREKESLIIIDEVQTGMGRTGTLFGYQQFGIEPDIITLAKGLGNGFPVAAIVVRRPLGKEMPQGMHASTFGGNFLACAVANAVLDTMDESFLNRVQKMSQYFGQQLTELQKKYPAFLLDIRVYGLMIGIDLAKELPVAEVIERFLAKGILTLRAGENTLRLAPPLIIHEKEIQSFIKAFDTLLQEKQGRTA